MRPQPRICMILIILLKLNCGYGSSHSKGEEEEGSLFIELNTHHFQIPIPYRPDMISHSQAEDEEEQMEQKPAITYDVHDDKPAWERLQPKPRMLAQMSVGGKYISEPEDTEAQHGDPCNPSGALEWDYCEKAAYPNKGRMICAGRDDLAYAESSEVGTCICKLSKLNSTTWVQLRYDKNSSICRSPNGGACYVKFHTGKFTKDHQPIYQRNLTKSHDQCDDEHPLGHKKRTLCCSKPNPRKFSSYNAYHYYCLKKADRLLELDSNCNAVHKKD